MFFCRGVSSLCLCLAPVYPPGTINLCTPPARGENALTDEEEQHSGFTQSFTLFSPVLSALVLLYPGVYWLVLPLRAQ